MKGFDFVNKVVLIGCGNVGMAYAYSLINQNLNIDELVLIDVDENKLKGKVMDLNHCIANVSNNISIRIGDYADCKDANIVCITAGPSQSTVKTSRMEDLYKANEIFHSIVPAVSSSGFSGIYLIASNPLDVMTYVTWKYAKCDQYKVIGSGTLLDTARLKYVLSERKGIPIDEITGYVLGEHGDSQFVNWSNVNVSNITDDEKVEIADEVKKLGFTVGKYQGFTCYGIASSLTRITKSILFDEKCVLPVSSYDEKSGIYISTPSKIGRNGIEETRIMNLSKDEYEAFENSIRTICTAIGSL